MKEQTNTKASRWLKGWGLCVMLLAGLLVAQENTNPTTDPSPGEIAPTDQVEATENEAGDPGGIETNENPAFTIDRYEALMAGVAVFVVSVFVGFEVITKVPQTLHTPLMSGSNAISGITIVGALILSNSEFNNGSPGLAAWLAFVALIMATINVVGGFMVTNRMLEMIAGKKRKGD
mgnify:CR=1 FL=1